MLCLVNANDTVLVMKCLLGITIEGVYRATCSRVSYIVF